QRLHALPGLPPHRRNARRIQRQVHGEPARPAGRLVRHAPEPHTDHVPQLPSPRIALAVLGDPAREGCGMRTTSPVQTLSPRSPRCTFRQDVLAGMSKRKKTISPKYLYDTRGSRLYDEICELDEYYPTRTELSILNKCAAEVGMMIGPDARIVELGSG